MLLTLSKRFEFSASRRLAVPGWTDARNREVFGPESAARHGSGRNYTAVMIFTGPVDPRTGMVINVTEIKAAMKDLLARRYDHKFLNRDSEPFDAVPPTPEHVAARLLADAVPLFAGHAARPVACHLNESSDREATAYRDGTVASHHLLDWSAARQTMSPHLSAAENDRLFGIASSPHGHGHHYRLRVTLGGERDAVTGLPALPADVRAALGAVHADLDHRHLNHEVPALAGLPMTTESLARWLFARLAADLPVQQVRLFERDDFFAEHHAAGGTRLGMQRTFDAAHRLHSPLLDDAANRDVYERCNNPAGHGHTYRVEATVDAPYDERSGTCGDFLALRDGIGRALAPWQDRHLDLETGDFDGRPSTSENIVQVLWPRLDAAVGGHLARLRLWETANNRFALRRDEDAGALTEGPDRR
ncbi:MAG: 6-carboxytetrahydropterin synthase [Candidatus Krumholzibacteriia bacterium]